MFLEFNAKIFQEKNNFYLNIDQSTFDQLYNKLNFQGQNILKIIKNKKINQNLYLIEEKNNINNIISIFTKNNVNVSIDDFIKYILDKNLANDSEIINNIEASQEYLEYQEFLKNNLNRELKEHQIYNSFFHYKLEQSANFSSPGSGKTTTILSTYIYLKNKKNINFFIVIGPKSSLISWKDEFYICFGKKPKVFTKQNLSDKSLRDNIDNDSFIKKTYELYDFMFLTYSDIQSLDKFSDETKKILNIIIDDNNGYLVVDESHNIKNEDSKSFKNCFNFFNNVIYKTLLSGTPIPNGAQDIYTQLQLMHHFWYESFWGISKLELKNMNNIKYDKFREKIKKFYVRTTKNDLNIPGPPNENLIEYELTDEEKDIYKKVMKSNYKSNFALFIRLLQCLIDPSLLKNKIINEIFVDNNANNFEIDDIQLDDDKNLIKSLNNEDNNINLDINFSQKLSTKMKIIIEKIKELTSNNLNVLVWSTFISSMDKLKAELDKLNIKSSIIRGETNLEDREKILNDFKNSKGSVLITNPQTLSESISLHKTCHHAIYLDFSYNLVHFLQSKDRIYRLGIDQNEIPNYYYFATRNEHSIEKKIWGAIMKKKRIMDEIINSDYIQSFDSKFSSKKFVDQIIGELSNGNV